MVKYEAQMKRLLILGLVLVACRSGGTSAIQKMGREHDVDGLLAAWDEAESPAERIAVIDGLTQSPDDDRGRALIEGALVDQPAPEVRVAAARALPRYEGEKVITGLIGALGDPWPAVRATARAGLESKSQAAHAALLEAATQSNHHIVRATALQILSSAARGVAEIRPWVGRVLAEQATKDDAPNVRLAAVEGLGLLEVQSARGILLELSKTDADSGVRLGAERALSKLGERPAAEIAVVAVLPLRDASDGRDPELLRLGRELSEYIAARLSGAKVCQVVDREKLETALAELKKIGRAVYDGDAPNAPELGRFKIANQLVYGSVSRQGPVYTLIVNRMDVATLQLVPGASATVTGYRADLDQLKVELAERLLAGFR